MLQSANSRGGGEVWKKAALVLTLVALAAGGVLIYRMGGPRNIVNRLIYDQRVEGHLKVGDRAPDVALTALDGETRLSLKDYIDNKPLVLIFASYT
jgi:hypothetical protein